MARRVTPKTAESPGRSANSGRPAGGTVYGRATMPDQFSAAAPALTPTSTPPLTPSLPLSPDAAPAPEDGTGDGQEAVDARDRSIAVDQPPRRRRRWIAIVVVALVIVGLGGGAGAGYSLLQPTVYGAEAELVIALRPELSDAAVDRAMQTQQMIIQSDAVLRPVAAKARVPLSRLRDAVSAELLGRSNILRLTVGDRSPARAVFLAQLITARYLRTASIAGRSLASDTDNTPLVRAVLLSPASALEEPLQPRPVRAIAAGTLLGLVAAAAAVILLVRPRFLARPSPYWE